MDLIARRHGWDPEIPTLADIKISTLKQWREILLAFNHIHKLWMDALIIITLVMIVGFGSYVGGKSIGPVVYRDNSLSVWFESDLPLFFKLLANPLEYGLFLEVHPLFPLVAYPSIHLLHSIAGIELITAIRIWAVTGAMLWIIMLYVLLRLMGCHRFDATLFGLLGTTSAAAMFWLVVPESFIPGSVSILLALMTVILAQSRNLSPLWYAGVNALTLGFTVTNWMAGIMATLVSHSLKRTVQIMVNGFFIMVILWMIAKILFPQAMFPFLVHSARTRYIFTPDSGGPLKVLTSFVFHSMIMPAFELVDRFLPPPADYPNNWPIMITQYAWPGSGPQPWGLISVVLWGALLACGLWAIVRLKQQIKLRSKLLKSLAVDGNNR
jgi:hypothetical protein